MKSILLTGKSNKSLDLLLELAHELGIKTHVLTEEQLEDAGLISAIKEGRTGKFVDTDRFLEDLK